MSHNSWDRTYPRPQLRRDSFFPLSQGWTLNGRPIRVPWPPQAPLSGWTGEVGDVLRYKTAFTLPEGFAAGNTVGINVSPMIQDNEKISGITMENYKEMISYIIRNTDMQIALIPHVVWERNDDRKPVHALYEAFAETGRVIQIGDGNCQELKGFIGRCRFFVGARTHATIAAYSTGVPTLVAGYSVKARGIARDLFGTEENYVLPVQNLKKKDDLTKGFQWLFSHEKEIREKLGEVMPGYKERALETGKEVDRLWEEFSRRQKI